MRAGRPPTLPIMLVYGWFRDAQRQGDSPVAEETLRRIAALYRIEAEIRGRPAEERLAARRAHVAPLVADMRAWLADVLAHIADMPQSPLHELLPWN